MFGLGMQEILLLAILLLVLVLPCAVLVYFLTRKSKRRDIDDGF